MSVIGGGGARKIYYELQSEYIKILKVKTCLIFSGTNYYDKTRVILRRV